MTTDLASKERNPMPKLAAALIALLACLLPLAAPTLAKAQSGPGDELLYPLVDLGDDLWTTQQLQRFQGPDRYQRLFEEKVLQQMYRQDPSLPASTAVGEIQRLRGLIEAARPSVRAEPLTFGEEAQAIFRLIDEAGGGRDMQRAAAAAAEVTKAVMRTKGQADADSPLDDTQYLTQVDMANQLSQTHREATETFQATRDMARGPQGASFANAYDTLYGPQTTCSVNCGSEQLIQSSAELRDLEVIRQMVDTSTWKIREEIKTDTGEVRMRLGLLEFHTQRELASIRLEVANTRADMAYVNAMQRAENREFKDFVKKWEQNEPYRSEHEAKAAAARKDAQERDTVLQGSKAAVYLISTFVGFHDKKLGKDIYTVGNSLIQIADTTNQLVKFLTKGAEVFANPMNYFNLVTMGSSLVSAVLPLIGVFGDQVEKPNPDQIILDEIQATREQINRLGTEMHERFDRIDQGLNRVFATLVENFAKLDFVARKIDGDLNTIKTDLANLQISVDNLERNMHQMTSDLGRRDLWHAIDEGLNWTLIQRDLPMQARDYLHFDSFFFTWATADALDSVAVGPDGRSTEDDHLLAELTKYPLETNINYFDQVLEQRLGVSLFQSQKLVNARDWALGARAFTQLALAWPHHAANGDPGRFERIADKGRALQSELGGISRSPSLFGTLFANYRAKKAAVEQALTADENAWLAEKGVSRAIVWGSPDEMPPDHQAPAPHVKYCGAEGPLSTPANATLRDMVPPQYLFARGLKAGDVEVCWTADWVDRRSTGSNANHTLRTYGKLQVSITARYKRAGQAEWATIRGRVYTAAEEQLVCRWVDEVDDLGKPHWFVECVDPAEQATWRWDQGLRAAFEQGAVASDNPALHAAVRSEIVELQRGLQTEHYRRVDERFGQAGDLRARAIRLSGATALLRGLIQLGLPRALAGDQLMSSLLTGDAAIYDGETMRRAYQAAVANPSGRNVLDEFTGNGEERAEVLAERVSDYLGKVAAGEYVEHQPLVRLTTSQVETARALTFRAPVEPPPPSTCEASWSCPPPPSCEATGSCPQPTPPPSPPPSCEATGTCPDTKRPTVSMSVAAQRLRHVRAKGLALTVKADEAGTAKVEVRMAGAKPAAIGRGSATLSAAGRAKVVVKLTTKARAKLARVRKARLTVRLVFTDPAGNTSAPATKQFLLKR